MDLWAMVYIFDSEEDAKRWDRAIDSAFKDKVMVTTWFKVADGDELPQRIKAKIREEILEHD